jgi:hypothetical protein
MRKPASKTLRDDSIRVMRKLPSNMRRIAHVIQDGELIDLYRHGPIGAQL